MAMISVVVVVVMLMVLVIMVLHYGSEQPDAKTSDHSFSQEFGGE